MKKEHIWVQALFWAGLYFFWVMVFQKRELAFSQTVTVEFCYLLFIAANYYFNALFNIPRFLHRRKYLPFILFFFAGALVTALLRVPLAMYLNKNVFIPGKELPGFSVIFIKSLLNISIWTVAIVAGKLIIDRFQFQQYVDEITKQKEQAELDFLNAQFNPHFLFNSINSIYGHIDKHNTTARNMLLTFSEMLRYQLYDCNENIIPIDKEINYIKNYVLLQQARKNEGLLVNLQIADSVQGFPIAPLLFIAFIENSFKYVGDSEETENRVEIDFDIKEDILHFRCRNTKDTNYINNDQHKGIGIANAKRRLALLYPKKNELSILDDKIYYEVNLKIRVA